MLSNILPKLPLKEDMNAIQAQISEINIPEPLSEISIIPQQIESLTDAIKGINIEIPSQVTVGNLDKLINQFNPLLRAIQDLKTSKITEIKGKVEISNLPSVDKIDLSPLIKEIKDLKSSLPVNVKSEAKPIDLSPLLEGLSELRDEIVNLQPKEIKFPTKMDIGNFPPRMVPQPVTNININGLQGYAKTTAVTVGTTLTKLPSYGQLFNRRAIVVYNNSSTTVYVGGSDLTSSNGLPITANSFSPTMDAGYNMVIYGITSSGSADVRVMELSKDQSDTIQQ